MYIELDLEKVDPSIFYADEELVALAKKHGINIKVGDDLGKFMIIEDFGNIRYIDIVLMDSQDGRKNRNIPVTKEEEKDTLDYLNTRGFKLVESKPKKKFQGLNV